MQTLKDMSPEESAPDIAIIGGVSTFLPRDSESSLLETPFGNVNAYFTKGNGRNVVIVPRHADGAKHVPPHRINYRAIVMAIKQLGVERIISVNSVGTMKNHPIGSIVLAEDFLDFTRNRISTFYDDITAHVDMTEPYCPQIRQTFKSVLKKRKMGFSEGVYVCTEGPRFETRAEIRMMSQFGDFVGMTGVPEVVLAKELKLCYASVCTVTNNACGMDEKKVTASEVVNILQEKRELLFDVIMEAIEQIPENRNCHCSESMTDACL
ncbi:MTAP family purine nucleoside phosphorylase [Methanolobus sp. ZRKC2]|uniref:MTAP family purine nucleoside phosphorylase n=1 Tax=Methanolobus sp. ZRKC2 TaxID=3125783 RepID=UPI003247139F